MFKYIILLSTIFLLLNANEVKQHPAVTYDESVHALKSIEHDGIVYGSGEHVVYVFLDPLCPYSRKFLSLVSKNESMLSKYRYYIYLYKIDRLHSEGSIAAIYSSKNPIKTLLEIMLNDAKLTTSSNQMINKKMAEIEEVAQQLYVNKRPFLIVEK